MLPPNMYQFYVYHSSNARITTPSIMLLFGQTTGGLHLRQHYTQLLTVSKQSAVSVILSPASSLITSIWSTRFERTDSPIARPLLTLNVHVCFCCVDP